MSKIEEPVLKTDELFLNMGPQHPSTHGVLRLGLTIQGEVVVKAEPHVGYLHRGTEKLMEYRTFPHCLVLSDRWDYVCAMTNNLAVALAAEKLLDVEVPERGNHIRVIASELNRIASHLLFFSTYGVDLGGFTAFLHGMRDREYILDLFEMLCGARLTYNYIRIGGVARDLPDGWTAKCREFLDYLKPRLQEYDDLLSFNPIFLDRSKTVGIISREAALDWGLTGPNLRASGVDWDVRKGEPHCGYEKYDFETAVSEEGSCWARFYCRVREMRESIKIVEQALKMLAPGPVVAKVPKLIKPKPGEAYAHVEGARGNIGIYMVSDGNLTPYRVHVRPPSFLNLQFLQEFLVGQKMADVVAILGSIDIVLGEVDR